MSLVVFMSLPNRALAAPAVPEAGLVGVSSAIVYDLDNDAIIFEQNADAPIPPASITKVLSMFWHLTKLRQARLPLIPPCLSARKRRPRADRAWASRAVKQFP